MGLSVTPNPLSTLAALEQFGRSRGSRFWGIVFHNMRFRLVQQTGGMFSSFSNTRIITSSLQEQHRNLHLEEVLFRARPTAAQTGCRLWSRGTHPGTGNHGVD